jgi:hypothetical protein
VIWGNLSFHREKHADAFFPLTHTYTTIPAAETAAVDGKLYRTPQIPLSEHFSEHPWPAWKTLWQANTLQMLSQALSPAKITAAETSLPLVFPLRGTYLWVFVGAFLICGLYARSRGPAWFHDGAATHAEAPSILAFILLWFVLEFLGLGLYHNGTSAPLNYFHLLPPLAWLLVSSAESLRKWAERRGQGGRSFTLCYRFVHLTILVHMVICLIAFRQKLP